MHSALFRKMKGFQMSVRFYFLQDFKVEAVKVFDCMTDSAG